VMANPAARAVLDRSVPELMQSPMSSQLGTFPLGPFLEFALTADAGRAADILSELGQIQNKKPLMQWAPARLPDLQYEDDSVRRASARVITPTTAHQYAPVEVELAGPSHGNPFVDVEVGATFQLGSESISVGGFYNGDGRYLVRFLPPRSGAWRFVTASNARSLDGIAGDLVVHPSENRGPVRVSDGFAFRYADSSPYTPFGTTAYAWTQQSDELQFQTLDTLEKAPFNKLRMCVFPKDFLYNSEEPERYPFLRCDDGTWDTERFDVDYFANLDRRVAELDGLGIQADIILFHPYDDRWGFSRLGPAVDERYLKYVVRRLSAYPNVWWSLANEYELLTTKRPEDWERIAATVRAEDHVNHLLSIHNWSELFDYTAAWATHCSIQGGGRLIGQRVDEWRRRWGKPVIVDEYGYEGDLDQGWGNLTAEEVVERTWSAVVRGGYVTHGETFYRDDEVIFWSKGGKLRGESAERIRFLQGLVAESPTARIDPLPSDWDVPWGGVAGEYALLYFGSSRPKFRHVVIPAGMRAHVDVIDTWNMSVERLKGIHQGKTKIELPARPYMAIRLVAQH
jgi:hypothetical protein